jgi:hypothetical protein
MINEYFVTQSLNVAAYLRYKGFKLQEFIKQDKIASYCFDKSPEVFSAVNEYNQNNDLKRFINSYREIRELIYKK